MDELGEALLTGVQHEMARTPLRAIKVAPLCRTLGISRSAFYDRFNDIFDVAATLEQRLLGQLGELVCRIEREHPGPYETCLACFSFFAEHHALVHSLLASELAAHTVREIDTQLGGILARELERTYDLSGLDSSALADIVTFATAGFYHFYLYEDAAPNGETIERRAHVAAAFCDAGLKAVLA